MPQKDDQYSPIPNPRQMELLQQLPHRVQSAIAFLQSHAEKTGESYPSLEPKHLRVGVNSAMIEASALGKLLMRKKLITADEYFNSIIEMWEQEVESYQGDIRMIDPRLKI